MNKHVAKLLQPGVFWYCLIMLAFAAAAALFDQYYLAVGELVVTVIVMVVSRLLSVRRRNALMRYVQSATDAEGISVHAGSPFPMAGHPPAGGRDHLGQRRLLRHHRSFRQHAVPDAGRCCPRLYDRVAARRAQRASGRPAHRRAPVPHLRKLRSLGGRRDDRTSCDHLLC
ncbi:MAG: hypothetical protein ACLR8U_04920 [Oscillospiraceae bacterium]